ncbi:hypothetical protein NLG97_g1484 [Lecanicillium saksenae]|uniref:Uncharacterized protein n=1 Tax=Lecanicillium saksenae TaxID=468837 RepID=A0ACC1R3U8_9HYPO|nr:hypothetical protein NLG97_g1484 [Lecanicillium saksenae]
MGDVSPASIFSLNALFDNPLFAGGIGLASLGAAAAFARKGVIVAAGAARRRLLVNVEISKQDPAYPWILAWLSTPRPTPGFLASRLTRIHNLSVTTATASKGSAVGGPPSAHFFLQPGYGRHIVKFRNAFIAVNREKHNTANMNTGEPHEIVQLRRCHFSSSLGPQDGGGGEGDGLVSDVCLTDNEAENRNMLLMAYFN